MADGLLTRKLNWRLGKWPPFWEGRATRWWWPERGTRLFHAELFALGRLDGTKGKVDLKNVFIQNALNGGEKAKLDGRTLSEIAWQETCVHGWVQGFLKRGVGHCPSDHGRTQGWVVAGVSRLVGNTKGARQRACTWSGVHLPPPPSVLAWLKHGASPRAAPAFLQIGAAGISCVRCWAHPGTALKSSFQVPPPAGSSPAGSRCWKEPVHCCMVTRSAWFPVQPRTEVVAGGGFFLPACAPNQWELWWGNGRKQVQKEVMYLLSPVPAESSTCIATHCSLQLEWDRSSSGVSSEPGSAGNSSSGSRSRDAMTLLHLTNQSWIHRYLCDLLQTSVNGLTNTMDPSELLMLLKDLDPLKSYILCLFIAALFCSLVNVRRKCLLICVPQLACIHCNSHVPPLAPETWFLYTCVLAGSPSSYLRRVAWID